MRGTLQIGPSLSDVTLFMNAPQIDTLICELVALRQKVAELAKVGEDNA